MKFDFSQNQQVEALSTVPDNFQCFYAPVPGANEGDEPQGFKIREDEPAVMNAINAITGLNNALNNARRDVDDAKKNVVDLSPLRDYGDDPKAIADTVAKKLQAMESRSGQDVKSQVDAIKQELAQAHAQTITQSKETIENLTSQLDNHMVTNAIAAACPALNNASPDLVAPFARRRMRIDVDHDTKARNITPLTRDGNVMYSMDPNRAGEKASIVELLKDMSAEPNLAPIFPSAQRQGSGAADSAGIPKSKKNIDDMDSNQMISEGLNDLK